MILADIVLLLVACFFISIILNPQGFLAFLRELRRLSQESRK